MRRLAGLILFLLLAINASAQNRQLHKTDSVYRLVKQHFNAKFTDAIYNLTSAAYKREINLATFKSICAQELFPLGSIKKDSLISFVNNKTATYKVQFDAVTYQLLINLDGQDKIDLLLFQTYRDPSARKLALALSSNLRKTAIDKMVDSVARPYIQKANTVGLSIGIIKGDKTYTYNYGETAKGNKKLPISSTLFEIGSITKTFTGTLLAWYVNEGKINLSDPITKYLPDSVAGNPSLYQIRIVNLINHTSGLPGLPTNFTAQQPYEQLNPYKNYTAKLLYAYLKNCDLKTPPGEKYVYSNLAVALLGTILEKIGGKPYDQLVNEIICKPLQMKYTVQHLYPAIATRFTTVYNEDGNQTLAWDFDVLTAHGALKSTIDDLLLYTKANMHVGNDKLSKAFELAHKITFDSNDTKVALGWHMIRLNGVSYYFHNGGTYGSRCFLAYNAEKKTGVIILSNADEDNDAMGHTLLKKLQ